MAVSPAAWYSSKLSSTEVAVNFQEQQAFGNSREQQQEQAFFGNRSRYRSSAVGNNKTSVDRSESSIRSKRQSEDEHWVRSMD